MSGFKFGYSGNLSQVLIGSIDPKFMNLKYLQPSYFTKKIFYYICKFENPVGNEWID